MASDYSHRRGNGSGRRGNDARRGSRLPTSVAVFLGLTIGIVAAAFVFIAVRPAENTLGEGDAIKRPAGVNEQGLPQADDGRFAFYDMLPNYEIVVQYGDKPGAEETKAAPKPIEQPGSYIIQAGSFSSDSEADRRKATLALLGIESTVATGPGPDGATRYRIRIGPLSDLTIVNDMLRQLRENGIEALLMRQKG